MAVLRRYPLLWILLLALSLRLAVAFQRNALEPYQSGRGGDEAWYMANGWGLMSGQPHGWIRGVSFYVEVIPGAPAYLVLVGTPQMFLSDEMASRLVFILQALMGTAGCFFTFRTTTLLAQDKRAGWVVAFVLAISPVFVMVTGWILTEPLYIFLTTAGIWVYMEYTAVPIGLHNANPDASAGRYSAVSLRLVLAGALFGLAVLTRAVLLLFPLIVALHLLILHGRKAWRRGLLAAGILLVSYALVVSTWTVFNLVNFNRFVIASTQMMPAIWRGAVTDDTTPDAMDSVLMPDCAEDCTDEIPAEVYQRQILAGILSNVTGFIGNRLTELAAASLEPFGTAEIGGESLRGLTLRWLREDFTLNGFLRLVNAEHFWLKLVLYLLHYGGMVFGLAGLWQMRQDWRVAFVPAAFIVYTYGLHVILLALPRYIFPTQVYWWVFTAVTLVWTGDWLAVRLRKPLSASVPSEVIVGENHAGTIGD